LFGVINADKLPDMDTVQERLVWARKRMGYTQAQVAEAIGVSQPTYGQLELGKSKSSSKLPELAKLFRVDAYWLATGSGERDTAHRDPKLQNILEIYDSLSDQGKAYLSKQASDLSELFSKD
jgi:transcriptional regulator with XRE-family HTH domain